MERQRDTAKEGRKAHCPVSTILRREKGAAQGSQGRPGCVKQPGQPAGHIGTCRLCNAAQPACWPHQHASTILHREAA
eukprot:scaffold76866_cov17-Tisochrysis_lutea.AAC.1